VDATNICWFSFTTGKGNCCSQEKQINNKYKTISSYGDQIDLSIKTSSTFVLYISGKCPNIEVLILVNTLSADLGLEPNLITIDARPNIS